MKWEEAEKPRGREKRKLKWPAVAISAENDPISETDDWPSGQLVNEAEEEKTQSEAWNEAYS